tara:strand:- start:9897 stop:10817 length:921 start_codon:yes stop_codon:yes gene_type:complete
MDYLEEGFNKDCEILFISDSYKLEYGELTPFSQREEDLIYGIIKYLNYDILGKIEFTAAVKCPQVKDSDIGTVDKNICRNHIWDTILSCPNLKLIFVCGNLPMVMLTKKSGITTKRGKKLEYNGIPVIPIFNPTQVLMEPQNEYLFKLDIQNGFDQHYFKKESKSDFIWELLYTDETLSKLDSINSDVAIDIETTGLDFMKDEIQTIALTSEGNPTYVVPVFHKEFDLPTGWCTNLLIKLNRICKSEHRKIFHKAQFDTKFLARFGITEITNIWDTKLMQHMIDENLPKGLKDLVGYYFPDEQDII